MNLTQDQLNAGVIIRALSDLCSINTNPKFGYGRDTLELVVNHLKGWDYHNRKELLEIFDRIKTSIEVKKP